MKSKLDKKVYVEELGQKKRKAVMFYAQKIDYVKGTFFESEFEKEVSAYKILYKNREES